MAIDNLVVPEKLYVGVEEKRSFDKTEFPLAFSTPYGTDKAFEKRKDTVLRWMGSGFRHEIMTDDDGNTVYEEELTRFGQKLPKYTKTVIGETEPQVIDNTPLHGFTFDKSVSRWSTSNKWFRIQDPRGFTLEISAENLGEILLNGVIDHGTLIGAFVWARQGANNHLINTKNDRYINAIKPKVKIGNLKIGDVIETRQHGKFIYQGDYYSANCYWSVHHYKDSNSGRWPFARYPARDPVFAWSLENETKPWKVFTYQDENDYRYDRLITMRSLPKNYEVVSRGNGELRNVLDGPQKISNDWGKYSFFFETKDEAKDFRMTDEVLEVLNKAKGIE
tara:strand:- start:84943 stop:85947 length:1005 start_codon:yes stop_codon:yes gene_type:complete